MTSQLGAGSRFALSLPQAAQDLDTTTLGLPDDADLEAPAGLYVVPTEDDVIVRESLQHMFAVVGGLCESFSDYEALAAQAEGLGRSPDVLISDYRLSAGRAALDVRRLQREVWPQVPLVVLSGEPLNLDTQP